MMIKYVYDTKLLRCRITRTGYKNQLQLLLQERKLFFFWVNRYDWLLEISEGFWGEEMYQRIRGNPMIMPTNWGRYTEVWATGTLNIHKRVFELFKEYYQSKLTESKMQKEFEAI